MPQRDGFDVASDSNAVAEQMNDLEFGGGIEQPPAGKKTRTSKGASAARLPQLLAA